MNTSTLTRPTACGCEPDEPFCSCPSAAAALFDDRYDHHDHHTPFDPFHTADRYARVGVRA